MKNETVLEILSYIVPIGLGIYVIKTALKK